MRTELQYFSRHMLRNTLVCRSQLSHSTLTFLLKLLRFVRRTQNQSQRCCWPSTLSCIGRDLFHQSRSRSRPLTLDRLIWRFAHTNRSTSLRHRGLWRREELCLIHWIKQLSNSIPLARMGNDGSPKGRWLRTLLSYPHHRSLLRTDMLLLMNRSSKIARGHRRRFRWKRRCHLSCWSWNQILKQHKLQSRSPHLRCSPHNRPHSPHSHRDIHPHQAIQIELPLCRTAILRRQARYRT